MLLYEKICDENKLNYGIKSERVLKIIINQYSDRTHFIYEILQNAEDAGASYIKFYLKKDEIRIFHNGRLFDENDVRGVCGIADGTKDDGTRIGHFGIGFKSVYCYTEKPEIYSGEYHFMIENQLFPSEVPLISGLRAEETSFILPFDKKQVPPETAYKEIKDALTNKIRAESIIMLSGIKDVKIEIEDYPELILINKKRFPLGKGDFKDKVFSLSLNTTRYRSLTDKQYRADSDYLLFTDNKKEECIIIFKVEGKEPAAVKNSRLYAFFPTARETHQNFYIHAPFDTTPARDNFKEGEQYGKHNLDLIKAVNSLIRSAFIWMRDNGYLSVSGFNSVFPVYEYEEDDLLYGLYENSIEIIGNEAVLPANDNGKFIKISEAALPLWTVITEVFDDADLRQLKRNPKISWLSKEFSKDAYKTLREFLNKNFNVEQLDWKDLVNLLDSAFLKQKDISWTANLMSGIESYCLKRNAKNSSYIDASKIPFVRTSDKKQITARSSSGRLNVYLNNPDIALYKIDRDFLKNSSIINFYKNALEIPEYDIVQEVSDNILPKYAAKDVKFKTDNPVRENIEDLKAIKDAVRKNPLMTDSLKDKYIVTDGKEWYRPEDLYIKSEDTCAGYSVVKDIIRLRFLSDSYFDGSFESMRLDENFFLSIGCHYGLRKIETDKETYLKAVGKYLGYAQAAALNYAVFSKDYISGKLNWAFNYEGFPEVFKDITKEKSVDIMRFLNSNTMNFDIKGELTGANDRNFSGKYVDSKAAFSMLGLFLSFEKWIYIKEDSVPHSPSEVDREDLIPDYDPFKRILKILPFKEAKSEYTKWLDKTFENRDERELVERYLSNPEKLLEAAKAMDRSSKAEAAKGAKKKSLKERIEEGDRKQKNKPKESESEISPISEKAKTKREENLVREFEASLDYFTCAAKHLTYTCRRSNEEERAFLEQEYGGSCQICLKRIEKYDGRPYFEAINILKFSSLPEKLQNSAKYGWNSLCLCPNCAAQFNYSSKKISTLYEQVLSKEAEADSDEPIKISIELPQGKARTIDYSPRHFIALKEALKIFADEE